MPHVYGTYPEDVWRARYDQINDFERELAASGCAILKIFLVVSQEEQKKHFLGSWMIPPSSGNSISPTSRPATDGMSTCSLGRRCSRNQHGRRTLYLGTGR
mgnify:CR=1 FL=1